MSSGDHVREPLRGTTRFRNDWAVSSPIYELETAQVRFDSVGANETREDRHAFASQHAIHSLDARFSSLTGEPCLDLRRSRRATAKTQGFDPKPAPMVTRGSRRGNAARNDAFPK